MFFKKIPSPVFDEYEGSRIKFAKVALHSINALYKSSSKYTDKDINQLITYFQLDIISLTINLRGYLPGKKKKPYMEILTYGLLNNTEMSIFFEKIISWNRRNDLEGISKTYSFIEDLIITILGKKPTDFSKLSTILKKHLAVFILSTQLSVARNFQDKQLSALLEISWNVFVDSFDYQL